MDGAGWSGPAAQSEKTSTRTLCAFEVAAYHLGAQLTYLDPHGSQIGHKESFADTGRVLGRLYDAIEFRGSRHADCETLAQYAGVPVYNGLTDTWHPTQALCDIVTMVDEMRSAGANITLRDDCQCPVGRHVGAAAYRIVQEALTNALKHAGVAHVQVTLSCTRHHLHLLVIDDGGVPPAPRAVGGGRGIVGMAERAKVLGGRLTAGPVEGGGFSVKAVLPLTPRDEVSPPPFPTRPGVVAR